MVGLQIIAVVKDPILFVHYYEIVQSEREYHPQWLKTVSESFCFADLRCNEVYELHGNEGYRKTTFAYRFQVDKTHHEIARPAVYHWRVNAHCEVHIHHKRQIVGEQYADNTNLYH